VFLGKEAIAWAAREAILGKDHSPLVAGNPEVEMTDEAAGTKKAKEVADAAPAKVPGGTTEEASIPAGQFGEKASVVEKGANRLERAVQRSCESEGTRLWARVRDLLGELSEACGATKETAEITRELESANDCEEKREGVMRKLLPQLSCVKTAVKPEHRDLWKHFSFALWQLQQFWRFQSNPQLTVENVLNFVCLAEREFESFHTAETKCCADCYLGPLMPHDICLKALKDVLEGINQLKSLVNSLLSGVESSASIPSLSSTQKEILAHISKIEAHCCSFFYTFGQIQSWYSIEYAGELGLIAGTAMHYFAQVRPLVETMEFDEASSWIQFNDRLNMIPQKIETLKTKVGSLKPPVDPCSLQAVQVTISSIEAASQLMIGSSSSLQNISSVSSAQISQFRHWCAQFEQGVGSLFCVNRILRCGVREMVLELSSVELQLSCFLSYLQEESGRQTTSRGARAALATAPTPAMARVVSNPTPTTPGVQLQLPPGLVESFKGGTDASIQVIDPNTKNILEIVPADGSTNSLFVMANPGTVLQFKAFVDDQLVGSGYATAEA
jgi:hypothetical protein